jgi:hypothetical protein
MRMMRSNTNARGGRATTRIGHCSIMKTIYPETADLNIVVGNRHCHSVMELIEPPIFISHSVCGSGRVALGINLGDHEASVIKGDLAEPKMYFFGREY